MMPTTAAVLGATESQGPRNDLKVEGRTVGLKSGEGKV